MKRSLPFLFALALSPSIVFAQEAPTYAAAATPAPAAKAPAGSSSNYDESKVRPYMLPDLFTFADGSKVTTTAQWETRRRGELLELFSREMYGVSPPKPAGLTFRVEQTDPHSMDGQATRKQIALSFPLGPETFTFRLTLFVPNALQGCAPVFLLLNHRPADNTDPTRVNRSDFWPAETAIARGYAIAAVNVSADVEPDRRDATTGVRASYRKHSSKADELTWGTIAAWAWAGSRAVDYFESDDDIDAARIAVVGHSRSGKSALWAAAQDTRFALACVNGAGEGGPALARRNFGETILQETTNFPHWFVPKYTTYAGKEDTLPFDQHQLIALVAPRGYHGGDGVLDTWADPRGSWLSFVEASKVWALWGKAPALKEDMPRLNDLLVAGPLAYHVRDGIHNLTTLDWKLYLDHADSLFKKTAN